MKKVIILLSCILAAGAIIISLMFFHKESDEEIVLNEIKTGDEKEYEDKVEAYDETLKQGHTLILIGDSYGINYDNDSGNGWIGWAEQFGILFPDVKYFAEPVGGTGFIRGGNGFEKQLKNIASSNDLSAVKDVVVIGGYNDLGLSQEQITEAMAAFVRLARDACPNARISYMYVANDVREDGKADIIKQYEDIYRKACDDNGAIYVENSQGILSEKDDMFVEEDDKNSGYHPSSKGCKKLAISIAEYTSNGVLTEKHKTTE